MTGVASVTARRARAERWGFEKSIVFYGNRSVKDGKVMKSYLVYSCDNKVGYFHVDDGARPLYNPLQEV